MKKLIVGLVALGVPAASCARPLAAQGGNVSQNVSPASLATPTQTSSTPLSESLLLVRYDSKTQVNILTALDPVNGYDLAGIPPIPFGQSYVYALSPDRKTLAAVVYPSGDTPHGAHLYLIDLKDWSLREVKLAIDDWVLSMEYAPDGRSFAITSGPTHNQLTVVDAARAGVLAQVKMDYYIRSMKFNAAATALMIYGAPYDPNSGMSSGPVVTLVGAGALSPLWSTQLSQVRDGLFPKTDQVNIDGHMPGQANLFAPGLAFAPDADVLYIADAEKEQLVSVDFAARSVQARAVRAERSWLEQLLALTAGTAHAKGADDNEQNAALSPDGRFLYVTSIHNESVAKENGEWEFTQTPLGLQVIRTADAVETGKFETKANAPLVSADGNYVYLDIWDDGKGAPATQIFDTRQGKIIASMSGFLLTPTHRLNGEPVLVSGYSSASGRTQLPVF